MSRVTHRWLQLPWVRLTCWGLGLSVLVGLVSEAVHVVGHRNLHTVLPGRVYRSAQLSAAQLRELVQQRRIQSVINLRGTCTNFAWYWAEATVTQELNIDQYDICLSANRYPPPAEIIELVQTLQQARYPVLIHCRRGADRTGLAAVIARLLQPGADLASARGQLSLRYGHLRLMRAAYLDEFLDQYANTLRQHGRTHSPEAFIRWVQHDYRPGVCVGRLELVGSTDWRANQPGLLRVRATNLANAPWVMRAGTRTGVHLRYTLVAEHGPYLHVGHAGQFDATVPPGQSIELALPIPPLPAGNYCLQADLVDAEQNAFAQVGGEPLFCRLPVRP